MAKYQFLSDEWIAAARKLREEADAAAADSPDGQLPAPAQTLRMNMVVNEMPFGDGPLKAHLDTSQGDFEIDLGHLDDAEVTVTLGYHTAKQALIDQNSEAAMQAFMAGKVVVEGDMVKLLGMMQGAPDGGRARDAFEALRDITE